MIFCVVWNTFVYDIIAAWVWSPNGWLNMWGFKDYAGRSLHYLLGGLAVHQVAGFSGLAACLVMGKRRVANLTPHNLPHTILGTVIIGLIIGIILVWMVWI